MNWMRISRPLQIRIGRGYSRVHIEHQRAGVNQHLDHPNATEGCMDAECVYVCV